METSLLVTNNFHAVQSEVNNFNNPHQRLFAPPPVWSSYTSILLRKTEKAPHDTLEMFFRLAKDDFLEFTWPASLACPDTPGVLLQVATPRFHPDTIFIYLISRLVGVNKLGILVFVSFLGAFAPNSRFMSTPRKK
jgi:hypothetical protein